ncbi:hypothetical protein AB0M66_27310 [Streptomyces albidoflavus]
MRGSSHPGARWPCSPPRGWDWRGPRELRVALPTLVDALRPAGPGPR